MNFDNLRLHSHLAQHEKQRRTKNLKTTMHYLRKSTSAMSASTPTQTPDRTPNHFGGGQSTITSSDLSSDPSSIVAPAAILLREVSFHHETDRRKSKRNLTRKPVPSFECEIADTSREEESERPPVGHGNAFAEVAKTIEPEVSFQSIQPFSTALVLV